MRMPSKLEGEKATMPRNLNDVIEHPGPALRKKLDAGAAHLIAAEMPLRGPKPRPHAVAGTRSQRTGHRTRRRFQDRKTRRTDDLHAAQNRGGDGRQPASCS